MNEIEKSIDVFDIKQLNIVNIKYFEYTMKLEPDQLTRTQTLFYISEDGSAYTMVNGRLENQTELYQLIVKNLGERREVSISQPVQGKNRHLITKRRHP